MEFIRNGYSSRKRVAKEASTIFHGSDHIRNSLPTLTFLAEKHVLLCWGRRSLVTWCSPEGQTRIQPSVEHSSITRIRVNPDPRDNCPALQGSLLGAVTNECMDLFYLIIFEPHSFPGISNQDSDFKKQRNSDSKKLVAVAG